MCWRTAVLLLFAATVVDCQQRSEPQSPNPAGVVISGTSSRANEILAMNDQLVISASDIEGLSDKAVRIEPDGTVFLPVVGKLRAEGLTVEQFRKDLAEQLAVFVRSPRVSVKWIPERTDTIVVTGAFKNPGIHTLRGRRTLADVVSAVGGLQPTAGQTIRVTRRLDRGRIPLPSAVENPVAQVSTAIVNFHRLMENPEAAEHITVEPSDVLSAELPGKVFLTGEVLKAGAFELADRDSIGVTELVSLAGGFTRDAAAGKAKVLRNILNGSKRAEIPVDIGSILDGRSFDFPVQADDIVVVPRAKGKANGVRAAVRYVVPALVSAVIYVALRR